LAELWDGVGISRSFFLDFGRRTGAGVSGLCFIFGIETATTMDEISATPGAVEKEEAFDRMRTPSTVTWLNYGMAALMAYPI
jgi:hypothetical protein